jgi:hypothetical protein
LVNLISLVLLCSCVNVKEPDDETITTNAAATDTVVDTENPFDQNGFLKDNLPADINLGGRVVTTLYWSDVEHEEFKSETLSGDLVNDAIFSRNSKVEERLSIELEYIGRPGNVNNLSSFSEYAKSNILAGTNEFDIIASYSRTTAYLAANNFTENLFDFDNLDFSKPWWPEDLTRTATIKNRLLFCSGDISANMLYMMYVTFFNKSLLNQYSLENPYELVEKNEWTIDKMLSMTQGAYVDLNTNQKKDAADQFGLIDTNRNLDALFVGSGLITVEKDENDLPVISPLFGSEKTQNLVTKICTAYYNTNDCFYNNDAKAALESYGAGKGIFIVERSRLSFSRLTPSGIDYGIVPVPKYDTEQTSYITHIGFPYTIYAIPTGLGDPENVASVLECLASESYRQVTPAVFELSMKIKYSNDDISAKMFDIARETVSFDLGILYCTSLNNLTFSLFRNSIISGSGNFTVSYNASSKMLDNLLNKLVTGFN